LQQSSGVRTNTDKQTKKVLTLTLTAGKDVCLMPNKKLPIQTACHKYKFSCLYTCT